MIRTNASVESTLVPAAVNWFVQRCLKDNAVHMDRKYLREVFACTMQPPRTMHQPIKASNIYARAVSTRRTLCCPAYFPSPARIPPFAIADIESVSVAIGKSWRRVERKVYLPLVAEDSPTFSFAPTCVSLQLYHFNSARRFPALSLLDTRGIFALMLVSSVTVKIYHRMRNCF